MDRLVNPVSRAETMAVLARLLDSPGSAKELAGALRELAFALDSVANGPCRIPQRPQPNSYQI